MIGNVMLIPYIMDRGDPEQSRMLNQLLLENYKIVFVSEMASDTTAHSPYIVPASILMPPYEAMSELIDEHNELAFQIYYSYVTSYDIYQYLLLLMASAAFNQQNLAIMFDRDAYDLQIVEWLGRIILQLFGLCWGTVYSPMKVDEIKLKDIVSSIMYNRGMIDYEQFITYHASDIFTPNDLLLMVTQQKPNVDGPLSITENDDLTRFAKYFADRKHEVNETGKFLIDPLERLR